MIYLKKSIIRQKVMKTRIDQYFFNSIFSIFLAKPTNSSRMPPSDFEGIFKLFLFVIIYIYKNFTTNIFNIYFFKYIYIVIIKMTYKSPIYKIYVFFSFLINLSSVFITVSKKNFPQEM